MWRVPVKEKSLRSTWLLGDWDPVNNDVRGSRVLGTRTSFCETVQATCEPWDHQTTRRKLSDGIYYKSVVLESKIRNSKSEFHASGVFSHTICLVKGI
jgi:hypothetical protein